jgi:hypothetical protein
MVFFKGVCIGNMYNMQGSTISDGCNSSIVPEIGAEEKKILQFLKKRLCCGIKYRGISERRVFDYYMVKVWLKVFLTTL